MLLMGSLPCRFVEVAAAAEAGGDLRHQSLVPAHEPADHIPVAAVPLGPAKAGESAHLVEARRIPGLGDDVGGAPARRRTRCSRGPGRCPWARRPRPGRAALARSKRKPSTCISRTQYSRQETRKRSYHGMVAVQGVAAAGEVPVNRAVLGIEVVEDLVGQALEVDRRPVRARPRPCG